jgi:hypothetical protein
VDSFFLPYRPAFGRVHSSRSLIVEAVDDERMLVDDCWSPAYRGWVHRRDVEAARHSPAVADPLLEPVFSGVHGEAEWFTVAVRRFPVTDRRAGAHSIVELLITDMTTDLRTPGARFGLDAMREMLAVPRRTLALVLRAELSSRRYLCSSLRNAFAEQPDMCDAVDRYQDGLRHLQAARDVAVKSLRHNRAEYDAYLADRCRAALANEERLLAVVQEEPWLASR